MATYDKEIDYGNYSVYLKLKDRSIYGSSRVGVRSKDIDMLASHNPNYSMKSVKYEIGKRTYELSNHLGNVLSVISDKPIPSFEHGELVGMLADVRVAQDYSPFGVTLSGRSFEVDGGYRYSFQGQEHDDEIKGKGNSVNYTYRMHDPRLGRFFAIDPLAEQFPYYSPYQFCSNSPILAVELEGLESSVQLNFIETSVSISRNENNQFVITTDQFNQIPSDNKAMANGSWGIRDLRAGGQWELYCPTCLGPYGGGAYVRLILPKLQVTRYVEVEKEREVVRPGTPEIPAQYKNINKETTVLPHYRHDGTQASNVDHSVVFAGVRVGMAKSSGKFKSLSFVAKVDNADTREILANLRKTYGTVNFSVDTKLGSDYTYQAIYSVRKKIKDKVAAVPDKVVTEKYTEKVPVTVDPVIVTP